VAITGALNLQAIEFARKEGGNCKERNIQGKSSQFASVRIYKDWIYPGKHEVEFVSYRIVSYPCREMQAWKPLCPPPCITLYNKKQ